MFNSFHPCQDSNAYRCPDITAKDAWLFRPEFLSNTWMALSTFNYSY